MTGPSRCASPLRATEELVRANFSDEAYFNLTGTGGERIEALAGLQKQFKTIVVLAGRQFGGLKTGLAKWRERVRCGEVEFDQSREEWFKEGLHAFKSLVDALDETFNRFHKRGGVFLARPRRLDELLSHKNAAQRTLDSWQTPEWEMTNERTVKLNKEQTRHLRARLNSCK